MAELAENSQNFNDKNINLAVIGSGDPRHFKAFKKTTGYGGLLFSENEILEFNHIAKECGGAAWSVENFPKESK